MKCLWWWLWPLLPPTASAQLPNTGKSSCWLRSCPFLYPIPLFHLPPVFSHRNTENCCALTQPCCSHSHTWFGHQTCKVQHLWVVEGPSLYASHYKELTWAEGHWYDHSLTSKNLYCLPGHQALQARAGSGTQWWANRWAKGHPTLKRACSIPPHSWRPGSAGLGKSQWQEKHLKTVSEVLSY